MGTALLNGSVKISGKALKDPVYLKPDELFRYRKSDQIASVEEAKVGLYTDWIKDRLVFDNDCLADILISMEGRYNMDIECPRQFAASSSFFHNPAGEHRRGDGGDESDCSD